VEAVLPAGVEPLHPVLTDSSGNADHIRFVQQLLLWRVEKEHDFFDYMAKWSFAQFTHILSHSSLWEILFLKLRSPKRLNLSLEFRTND
jgi:hypothetical protein